MISKEKDSVTEGLGFSWSEDHSFETDMMTQEGKAKIYIPVNETWNVGAETCIKIKTNHTARMLIGITLLFMVASFLLVWRMQALELKNEKLQNEIMEIKLMIPKLMEYRREQQTVHRENAEALSSKEDDNNWPIKTEMNAPQSRHRRQVNERENATELMENEILSTTSSYQGRDRERGKMNRRMALIREKDRIAIAKLKLKLKNARIRANQTKILASQPSLRCDPRAAYLVVNGPDVEIRKRGQHIGPWYIADNGSEYGFHDLWYKGLTLGSNGTTVIFSENGLHLIYAQVYYTLFRDEKNSEPEPLGFRIYLKKRVSASTRPSRPYQIAECVPSYPSTTYQTCFTQVAWYVESGDQIYLQHFTSSLPLIEAEKVGQTFLGIVKLSG